MFSPGVLVRDMGEFDLSEAPEGMRWACDARRATSMDAEISG